MNRVRRLSHSGFKVSTVGYECEIYDLERALFKINDVALVPYTIAGLLKSSAENRVPKLICRVVKDIALLHERYEAYEDMYGSISQTVPVSIECFDGFFSLHKAGGGEEYLNEIAYSEKAEMGITSIVKEYANGDDEELRIADVEDCLIANSTLQDEWSLSEHGYGKPVCIPTGEYFPKISTFYIEETELDFFIKHFVTVKSNSDIKQSNPQPNVAAELKQDQALVVPSELNHKPLNVPQSDSQKRSTDQGEFAMALIKSAFTSEELKTQDSVTNAVLQKRLIGKVVKPYGVVTFDKGAKKYTSESMPQGVTERTVRSKIKKLREGSGS